MLRRIAQALPGDVSWRTVLLRIDPIETASIGELRALQLERLRRSLRNAYKNLAHYRQSSMQPECAPESLRLLEDLRLFPFTTKQHLRDNCPFGMFAVPREQVVRIHACSGRRVTPEP